MDPFDLLPYETSEPRWFGDGTPKRNAYVELHNLIAAAGSRREFGPQQVARIEREYGVDFRRDFRDGRRGMYSQYLRYCVADEDTDMTPEELEKLFLKVS